VKLWQVIAGVFVFVFGAGVAFAAFKGELATKHDVAEEHAGASAALGSAQASTALQFDALRDTVQDLRVRQATADAAQEALTKDVSRLQGTADLLYLQLVEIAKTTGARRVAPPDPAAPQPITHPP
jgi:hypothetical protein